MRPFLPTLALLPLAGCGAEPSASLAELHPPSFEAKLPKLRELAAEDFSPSSARQVELEDLFATAYVSAAAPRLAMQAERLLLDSQDRAWILEQALEHELVNARAKAALELGRCRLAAGIFPLVKRLKYESDATVRIWVVAALAELGNHSGLLELVSAMGREATARDAGLQAMVICEASGQQIEAEPSYGELQQSLGELYSKWQATGRVSGAVGTGEGRDSRVQARIAAMMVQLQGFELRPVDDARFVLSRTGGLALSLLAQALQASEEYLRVHALEIVSDLGVAAESLAEQVLPLLADPLSRALAVRAVGQMRLRQAVPHLLALSYSEDLELRTAVALCLGPLGDRRGLPRLQELFADGTQAMDVRVAAAFSLAIFEAERPAYRFLLERRTKGDFHLPTIEELIERVDSRR